MTEAQKFASILEEFVLCQLSIKQLADRYGLQFSEVKEFLVGQFNESIVEQVNSRALREGSEPTRFVRGTKCVLKPDWWTGAKKSKYIPHYQVLWAQANNKTEVEPGYVVTPLDGDKHSEDPTNYVLMSRADATRHHNKLRQAKLKEKQNG